MHELLLLLPPPPSVSLPSILAEPLSAVEVLEENLYPSYDLSRHRLPLHLDKLSTDEEGWGWACSTGPVVQQQHGGEDEGARRQLQRLSRISMEEVEFQQGFQLQNAVSVLPVVHVGHPHPAQPALQPSLLSF